MLITFQVTISKKKRLLIFETTYIKNTVIHQSFIEIK